MTAPLVGEAKQGAELLSQDRISALSYALLDIDSFEVDDYERIVLQIISETAEACAKVADGVARMYPESSDSYDSGHQCAAESIAAAIRSRCG